MKNKISKIIGATMLSVAAVGTIGCATNNSNIAKKINNGVDAFVSSINKLDYVETSKKQETSFGKIISTSSIANAKYISPNASAVTIENTITTPAERTDNFKLYVLSENPYITFSSDNNSSSITMTMKFSTEKIETVSDDISDKINQLILKRSILMIYVNEIYNGNVTLSEENKTAINAYVNIIKENASFLNGNRGMVKNQLNLANSLAEKNENENLINYYIIKSGEALEIRSNKIDSTISAIDSIIEIVESNLSPSSTYYQSNLSNSYNNFISNINNDTINENEKLAKEIAESLNICIDCKKDSSAKNEDGIATLEENNIEKTQNNTNISQIQPREPVSTQNNTNNKNSIQDRENNSLTLQNTNNLNESQNQIQNSQSNNPVLNNTDNINGTQNLNKSTQNNSKSTEQLSRINSQSNLIQERTKRQNQNTYNKNSKTNTMQNNTNSDNTNKDYTSRSQTKNQIQSLENQDSKTNKNSHANLRFENNEISRMPHRAPINNF